MQRPPTHYSATRGVEMKKRLFASICVVVLLAALPAGASQKLYKVTYIVTGTGSALVSYHDLGGVVSKTVRLPFKYTFKGPLGTTIAIDAADDSLSSKAHISCAIEQPHLKTIRNSSSGMTAFVLCN
jgi:hypothetical protein